MRKFVNEERGSGTEWLSMTSVAMMSAASSMWFMSAPENAFGTTLSGGPGRIETTLVVVQDYLTAAAQGLGLL